MQPFRIRQIEFIYLPDGCHDVTGQSGWLSWRFLFRYVVIRLVEIWTRTNRRMHRSRESICSIAARASGESSALNRRTERIKCAFHETGFHARLVGASTWPGCDSSPSLHKASNRAFSARPSAGDKVTHPSLLPLYPGQNDILSDNPDINSQLGIDLLSAIAIFVRIICEASLRCWQGGRCMRERERKRP